MRISDWSSDVCSSDLFEAMGRRAYTQGLPLNYERAMRNSWPMWARCAWARGWIYQQPAHAATESIVMSFEREADRKSVVKGKSVSVRVDIGGRRIIKKTKHN